WRTGGPWVAPRGGGGQACARGRRTALPGPVTAPAFDARRRGTCRRSTEWQIVRPSLVYVMVYLNERDRLKHRELQKLSSALRDMAIVDERNRLAREIHDGLGGVLSSVVIQSEY